ncbi:MAG TPA: ABC transporter permease, partial [Candidatus Melainabacteria bacterium]|nr:ABC transporter permease [Candidatus Melainabacteria bacterium]
ALLGYFIGLSLSASLLLLSVALALTTAFVIAVSTVVSVATVYFRDMTHILGIFLNCLFYLTPIFYSTDQVPDGISVLFLLNPICYFLDYFRIIIYDGRFPSLMESLVPLSISLFSLLLALIVLKMKGRELIYRL